MTGLSGIPPHLIERAAALPENRGQRDALERALSASRSGEPVGVRRQEKVAQTVTQAPQQPPKRGEMNKTERRYLEEIILPCERLGGVRWWGFEALTFKIGEGVRYTPDFVVLNADGTLYAVEVKGGYVRDDATVKFKVAAGLYPWISWDMLQYAQGLWRTIRSYPRTLTRIDPP